MGHNGAAHTLISAEYGHLHVSGGSLHSLYALTPVGQVKILAVQTRDAHVIGQLTRGSLQTRDQRDSANSS